MNIKDVFNGNTKICIPILENNEDQIIDIVKEISKYDIDIVEWRIDYYKNKTSIVDIVEISNKIRRLIYPRLLLCTLRTEKEGGFFNGSQDIYLELYKEIIAKKICDIVDIEILNDCIQDDFKKEIVELAKENRVVVIGSYHNFTYTPDTEGIIENFMKIKKSGVDIIKMAYKPNDIEDVYNVVSSSSIIKRNSDTPFILISMEEIGSITRIEADKIGSRINYLSYGRSSAGGQISLEDYIMKK